MKNLALASVITAITSITMNAHADLETAKERAHELRLRAQIVKETIDAVETLCGPIARHADGQRTYTLRLKTSANSDVIVERFAARLESGSVAHVEDFEKISCQ